MVFRSVPHCREGGQNTSVQRVQKTKPTHGKAAPHSQLSGHRREVRVRRSLPGAHPQRLQTSGSTEDFELDYRGKLLDEVCIHEALHASSSTEEPAPSAAKAGRRRKASACQPAATAQREPTNTFRREHFFFGDAVSAVMLADPQSAASQVGTRAAAVTLPGAESAVRMGRQDAGGEGANLSPSAAVLHSMVTEVASPSSSGRPPQRAAHLPASSVPGNGVRKTQGADYEAASTSQASSRSRQRSMGGQAVSRHLGPPAPSPSPPLPAIARLETRKGAGESAGEPEVRGHPGPAGHVQRQAVAENVAARSQTTRARRSRRDPMDTAFAAALAGVEPGAMEVAGRRADGDEPRATLAGAERSSAGRLSEGHLLLRRPRVAKTASWVSESPREFRLGQESQRPLDSRQYRLSREEEVRAATYVKEGEQLRTAQMKFQAENGFAASLDQLALRVGLTSAAEVEFVHQKAAEARVAIWEAYKMMVYKLAQEYNRMGSTPMEDYVVAGTQGLYKSALTFDASRGAKLSTHAYYTVRHEMWSILQDEARTVSVSRFMMRKIGELRDAMKAARTQRREVSAADVAASLGWSPAVAMRVCAAARLQEVSADQPAKAMYPRSDMDDEKDALESIFAEDDEDMYQVLDVCTTLDAALAKLPEKERRVIEGIYGIRREQSMQKELGRELEVSHQRISQLRSSAMEHLSEQLQESLPYLVYA